MKKSSPPCAPPPATTVRLPADLHADLKYAAGINGNTMNAEIILRLRLSVGKQLQIVNEQNQKTHELLQELLARIDGLPKETIR